MKNEKKWHPNFIKYMNEIIEHPNYKGLPIEKKSDGSYSWIATAKTDIGKGRLEWARKKAQELGISLDSEGLFAKVMFEIHPTKKKICQVCGKEMFLYYIYPSKNLIKSLYKEFNFEYSQTFSIIDITKDLLNKKIDEIRLKKFFISKLEEKNNVNFTSSFPDIIKKLEFESRVKGKKVLSPGAMSNFPDRFDGFHSYNLCCRKTEDKGRSDENMMTYSNDRRAYQYFNDGNLRAADKFMKSQYFSNMSADHVGPISLGFVHDPSYLKPLTISENSSKRDRISQKDIETILSIYERTGIYPMSWYSCRIWEFIKNNYKNPFFKIDYYSDVLKQNLVDFMYILKIIKDIGIPGENFIKSELIAPKMIYFDYDYEFNSDGDIIKQSKRNKTAASLDEFNRFVRIAFESIDNFNKKDNRNKKPNLSQKLKKELEILCDNINKNEKLEITSKQFHKIISLNQVKYLKEL